jgi:hypothetical protein
MSFPRNGRSTVRVTVMGFGWRGRQPGRSSRRAPGAGDRWLSRQVRGLRPDRNPLRRRIDRAETYLLGGLFVASAVAVPFAAHAASHAAYESALQMQREQIATRHQVEATLTAVAVDDAPGYTMNALVPASATWTSVTGVHGSGLVFAPSGSAKGTKVKVWTNRAGQLTSPPIATEQVISQRDAATIGAVAGVAVMAVGAGGVLHFVFFRRRLAAWDADWLVTAPAWNRQSW